MARTQNPQLRPYPPSRQVPEHIDAVTRPACTYQPPHLNHTSSSSRARHWRLSITDIIGAHRVRDIRNFTCLTSLSQSQSSRDKYARLAYSAFMIFLCSPPASRELTFSCCLVDLSASDSSSCSCLLDIMHNSE